MPFSNVAFEKKNVQTEYCHIRKKMSVFQKNNMSILFSIGKTAERSQRIRKAEKDCRTSEIKKEKQKEM